MLLLLYAVIASSTVSGFRQAVINPGVNHAVDQIAFGLRSNGTATLAQAPAQDRPSVSFTLLSVESHFRREAPLIIQSNYEKFLVDQAGAKGFVDREMLAATYSTKTIKELQESTKKFMISSGNLGSKHEKRSDASRNFEPLTKTPARRRRQQKGASGECKEGCCASVCFPWGEPKPKIIADEVAPSADQTERQANKVFAEAGTSASQADQANKITAEVGTSAAHAEVQASNVAAETTKALETVAKKGINPWLLWPTLIVISSIGIAVLFNFFSTQDMGSDQEDIEGSE